MYKDREVKNQKSRGYYAAKRAALVTAGMARVIAGKIVRNEYLRFRYSNTPEKQYWQTLQHRYNLSQEDFSGLLGRQMGCCGICGKSLSLTIGKGMKRRCCVDHDHTKVKGDLHFVRGLLCWKCNLWVGYVERFIPLLTRTLAYLGVCR